MNRRFFTLVELLIVVAILALLASLLLPVLKHAVESGRNIVCGNNQRQIGVAFTNYAETYNDFPTPGPGTDWAGKPTTPEEKADGWARILAASEFGLALDYDVLASYCRNRVKGNVFVCPTSHEKIWSYGGISSDAHANYCLSYNGNPGWSTGWVPGKWVGEPKWRDIRRSDFPLTIDFGVNVKFLNANYTPPRNIVAEYPENGYDFYQGLNRLSHLSMTESPFVYRSFPGFWHGSGGNEYPLGGTANQLCIDGSVRVIDARNSKRYWTNNSSGAGWPNDGRYFLDRDNPQPLP